MIEKPFLEARLKIAQRDWKKAEKKWHKLSDSENKDDSWAVRAAETRMAFLNGQRQLLKEFIGLETATSDNKPIGEK